MHTHSFLNCRVFHIAQICQSCNLQVDISAGAELTYDYRFAGEARLTCYCGAMTCRGFVNEPRSLAGGDGKLRLPAAALRPLKQADLWHDDGST